jgi:hypothetical protein
LRATREEGTTATIKAYRRPPGDRQGGYFVRLGGLFQYKEPSRRGELKADIVVDLVTTARPGARNYPLNAARDGLQGQAGWAALDLAEEVERENESVARNDEDEVYDPEADDPGLRAGADELSALAAEAFAAPELQRALADAVGGIADFYAEQVKDPGLEPPTDSAAPPSSRAGDDGPRRPMVLPAGLAVAGGPGGGSPADALRDLLRQAQASRDAEAGGLPVLTPRAEAALDAVAAGQALDDSDLLTLATAVDRAAEVAVGPGGGGLVQVARGEAGLSALAPARAGGALEGRRNPFGRLAGLRISRKGYDRRRAARFKKTFQRWIPHLTAWDATLRLVAGEARIRRGFKPGFVLDDAVIGLTATTPHRDAVVYLHPDRFAQVIKAHRERPIAIAAFLHGVACHELTHLDGRMGQGHNEAFVVAREDLGHATGHLLPAIALLVARLLDLPAKISAEGKQIAALERQLARAKERGAAGKQSAAEVAKLRGALEALRAELAAAQAESARVGADCAGRCRACGCGPGQDADALVRKAVGTLITRPPAGVSAAEVAAFAVRRWGELVGAVRAG